VITISPNFNLIGHGVVYVATTTIRYLVSALCSILSIRRAGYDGPITIITTLDAPFLIRLNDLGVSIVRLPDSSGSPFTSRSIKTRLGSLSPYNKTLYLDCDTYIVTWDNEMWHACDDVHLVIALDLHRTLGKVIHGNRIELNATINSLGSFTPHYNSGIMLWSRSDIMSSFFDMWHNEWQRFCSIDQLALSRALHHQSIKLAEFPPNINVPLQLSLRPNGTLDPNAHIIHTYGRDYLNFVSKHFQDVAGQVHKIVFSR
jgi:hypothetical protein